MDQQETALKKFFKISGKVLQRNVNLEAHSLRQPCTTGNKEAGEVTYIPPCVLVCDLQEKYEMQCLEEGGMSEDVLSLSTLYPSFVQSNEWNAAAPHCFVWIPVKRGMTKSSG